MLILIVHLHVKPECVERFKEVTLANARASLTEPGVARFDLLSRQDDPNRFVLVEAYRSADAPAAHKATPHYTAWAAAVEGLLAEPRTRAFHTNVFPGDNAW